MITRRYVGARDVESRTGTCRACGKRSLLNSFETREFVTVLRLPLVPLGRFHVKDRCAACGRHQRMAISSYLRGLKASLPLKRRAAEKAPTDTTKRVALASVLRAVGDHRAAEEVLRQGLAAAPSDAELLLRLGELLEAKGRLAPALEALREAATLAPAAFRARLAHGRVLARLGQFEAAITELLEARKLDPHHPASHCLLGQCCARLDRRSDALRHYEELLGRRPELREDANAWRRIGGLKQALGYSLTAQEKLAARQSRVPPRLLPSPIASFTIVK